MSCGDSSPLQVEGVRTLLRALEVRQQCLLANIASCDELMAEITSLQAALCVKYCNLPHFPCSRASVKRAPEGFSFNIT